ncbi:MAG: T9SS C-terminal target domain-containing protein [bacterium TMED144]|nr:MAG: T9SS C-terminal target domain-containing protein [bacterium TMED144]
MKIKNLIKMIFFCCFGVYAQPVIEHSPLFPSLDKPIVLTFYADRGSKGLSGHNGDVYAHTGVITDKSTRPSDWKYVKTSWGQNTNSTRLTRIALNEYQFTINDIREYYGVPTSERIIKLAFVFRSADASKEGKDSGGEDIFISLYENSINLALISPRLSDLEPFIIDQDTVVAIKAKAETAGSTISSLTLSVNKSNVKSSFNDSIYYSLEVNSPGIRIIDIVAFDKLNRSDTLSFQIIYNDDVIVESLPMGVKDGINYNKDGSVTLVLHAPFKDFVYALGDFNNWEIDSNYLMKRTSYDNDTRWWITVNNLQSNKEYLFQYLVDGKLRIADPYTEKVVDPMNDIFIPKTVYPDPISYPFEKTNQIASVIQPGKEDYIWKSLNYNTPSKNDLIIYEILVRDFVQDHHYLTLIDTLDYLQNLGINAIELMPINEFEGNNSWGYNPSFLFAPDKYYGTSDELKQFIDACHKRGIAVLLDLVINHSYSSSPFVRLYTDGKPTSENPWFNRDHNFANRDAHWGNDWDHESVYTRQIFKRTINHWMQKYKVDGFRFDFTKGIGNNYKPLSDAWGSLYDKERINLLKQLADNVWSNNSNGIVIMEHLAEDREDRELADYGILLWANANFNFSEAIMGYNGGNNSSLSWTYFKNRDWSSPNMVTYMESHDEERVIYKALNYGNSTGNYNVKNLNTSLERLKSAGSIFFLLPGPKMIWQFGEMGYDISIDYNGRLGRKPIKWNYFEELNRKNIYNTWSYLIGLRKKHSIFSDPKSKIDTWLNSSIKKIQYSLDGENAILISNFDIKTHKTSVSLPSAGHWHHATLGEKIYIEENELDLSIPAGTFLLMTDFEIDYLPKDQAKLSVEEIIMPKSLTLHSNYPNPFNSRTSIKIDINNGNAGYIDLNVYDISGRKIDSIYNGIIDKGSHIFSWDASNFSAGIYFLKLTAKNSQQTIKLLYVK